MRPTPKYDDHDLITKKNLIFLEIGKDILDDINLGLNN